MATEILNLPVQYVRQQAKPIDIDTVFATTSDRTAYLTNARRYAGQIVSDLQTESIYVLSADRTTWNPIAGGGGSITFAGDISGSGSGTVDTTVTGLQGAALPDLEGGYLKAVTTGPFIPAVSITSFGDSITVGLNATDQDGYIQQFAANFNEILTNLAVSSQGVWQMANNAFASLTANATYVTAMAGLNDYRRSGTNSKTDHKVIGCYQSLLSAQWGKTLVDGSDTTDITWSTAPSTYAASTVGGPGLGGYVLGTSGVVTAIWDFTGTNVVVGLIGNSGDVQTFGTVKIYIDGVLNQTISTDNLYDNISDSSYDNRRGPYAVIITGLSSGSHTVKWEAQGDGICVLNYFRTLVAPGSAKPVVFCQIPHLDATGYSTSPANATDGILDAGSVLIQAIVTRFSGLGYPILWYPTMTYYNVTTGISTSDHIHPSDAGHLQIVEGLIATVIAADSTTGWTLTPHVEYSELTDAPTNVSAFTNDAGYIALVHRLVAIQNATDTNTAYFGSFNDFTQLAVNISPFNSTFTDGAKSFAQISLLGANNQGEIWFFTNNVNGINMTVPRVIMYGTGNVAMGDLSSYVDSGDAYLQISGGSSSKGQIQLGAGTLKTTIADGLLEYDGKDLHMTTGLVRSNVTDPEQFLGIVYYKNTWTSLADFASPTATVSVVSGHLQFTGGAGTYDQTLELSSGTMLEYWKITAQVALDEISGTSYGFGIGLNSINTYGPNSVLGRVGFTTGFNTLFLDNATDGTSFVNLEQTTVPTPSLHDIVELTLERVLDKITLSIRNITANSVTTSVDFSYLFQSGPYIHNTGHFSIFSFGGQFTVNSYEITSNEIKNAPLMVIGDSKTQGFAATTWAQRFGSLLNTDFKTVVHAGGFDRTAEVLAAINEIIALSPKQVILAIGSNDPRSGVSEPTYETNYSSISSQLLAAGIDVFYALPFYETSTDLSAQRTFILGTFPSGKIIDTWDSLQEPDMLYVDGIHPSDAGHFSIYEDILAAYVLKYRSKALGATSEIPSNIITGSGTTGTIPKFTAAGVIGDSSITEGVDGSFSFVFFNALNPEIRNALPGVSWYVTGGATDEHTWNTLVDDTSFSLTMVDDARTINTPWLQAKGRSSYTGLSSIVFPLSAQIGVGTDTPAAGFHLTVAGTATANTAPLKLPTGGVLLTTPEEQAVETTDSHFYWTDHTGTRHQLDQQIGGSLVLVGDADHTIGDGEEVIIFTDNFTSSRTCNLPTATGNTNRKIRIHIYNIGVGMQLNINSSSTNIFNENGTAVNSIAVNTLSYWFDFMSDGTSWYTTAVK